MKLNFYSNRNKIKIDPCEVLKQVRDAQKTKVEKSLVNIEGVSMANIKSKLVNSQGVTGKRIASEEKSKCLIF